MTKKINGMKAVLIVIGIITMVSSLLTCGTAKAGPPELAGLMEFLIGIVALTGAAILDALEGLKKHEP